MKPQSAELNSAWKGLNAAVQGMCRLVAACHHTCKGTGTCDANTHCLLVQLRCLSWALAGRLRTCPQLLTVYLGG